MHDNLDAVISVGYRVNLNNIGDFILVNDELLNIKQTIILNNEYKKWMEEISAIENEFALSSDFNNIVALDHGIEHMNRVADNVYKLLEEYNCNKKICTLGYIAGLIHDIGMIYGKKGHAQNGAEMSKSFLQKLDLLDMSDIEIVSNAIKNHGSGGENPDVITSFLAISDKADMCKARSLRKSYPIQFIENYMIKIQDSILYIDYTMTDLKGKEGLYIIPKSIDIPKTIVKNLGLQVKTYINGKYEEFKDRDDYQGQIYQRRE